MYFVTLLSLIMFNVCCVEGNGEEIETTNNYLLVLRFTYSAVMIILPDSPERDREMSWRAEK